MDEIDNFLESLTFEDETKMNTEYWYKGRNFGGQLREYKTLLNYIGEKRFSKDTYKKYLFISLSGKELWELSRGKINSLIRKNVPDWVIDRVKNGLEVEAFVFVKRDNKKAYFNFVNKKQIIRMDFNSIPIMISSGRRNQLSDQTIVYINGTVCARFKIKNIITSSIDKTGAYCDNIKVISEFDNRDIPDMKIFGKMKPIHLLKISDLDIFNFRLESAPFMTSFNVTKVLDGPNSKFVLDILKFSPPSFENMGTV